jgi:hypothetical protein
MGIAINTRKTAAKQPSNASHADTQLSTITDNRSATIAQRKLSDALSTSPRAQQVAQLSTITDNRSTTIAQRKLSDALFTSPRAQQVAQRQGFIITSKAPVQRAADEEEVQMKAAPIQRAADEEEVQMKTAPVQRKENNTGLPDNLKSGVEKLSGQSLDDVQVHRNSDQPAQMQAHAFAQGNQIHVAPGQEKHLPHEAWHVAQQKQGRVKPTTQMKGKIPVNDDKGLEQEADVMGAKALSVGNSDQGATQLNEIGRSKNTVQKEGDEEEPTDEGFAMEGIASFGLDSGGFQNTETGEAINGKRATSDEVAILAKKGGQASIAIGSAVVNSEALGTALEAGKGMDLNEITDNAAKLSDGIFGKVGNIMANVVASFVSPIATGISAFLDISAKRDQQHVFDELKEAESSKNGYIFSTELFKLAEYALGKLWKGITRSVYRLAGAVVDLTAAFLTFIPSPASAAGAAIMAGRKLMNLALSVMGGLKAVYQTVVGEKKVTHAKNLFDSAVKGDQTAIQLIFDLKLASITGSSFATINWLNEMSQDARNSIVKKIGWNEGEAHSIFSENGGPPKNAVDLAVKLKAAAQHKESEALILAELQEVLTGFGT